MQRKSIKRIESIEELLNSDKESNYFSNWKRDELANLVNSNNYECFSIFEDEQLMGFVALSIVLDSAEIIYIYINKDNRSSGLGFWLLEKVFDKLKEKSVTEVFLEVAENNQPARGLYKKLGFKQIGIRKKYYKNKIDALTYRLNL